MHHKVEVVGGAGPLALEVVILRVTLVDEARVVLLEQDLFRDERV